MSTAILKTTGQRVQLTGSRNTLGGYAEVCIPYTEAELLRARKPGRCHIQIVKKSNLIEKRG